MIRRVGVAVALVGVFVALGAPASAATLPPTQTPAPGVDQVRASEWWLGPYGIEEAWKTTRGKGVTVAVIDTGVAKVPELNDAVRDGTDVSGSGSPDGRTPVGVVDANHGTWVASLIAARGTGDKTGMIGVAPEANILSVSVGFGASAKVPFVEQIANGVKWAVDHGADVINLSLTTNSLSWDTSWDKAFSYAFDHDVVVVVAAGNRSNGTASVGAPATIPGVLTVAGVDPAGNASVGASTQGITIGVAAPSERLIGVSSDGKIANWNGTSGAAPIVAGIAALVRSSHPGLDANNIINRIVQTARPKTPGQRRDGLYGFGLVNAQDAVSANVPAVTTNPMGSLKDWIHLYRRGQVQSQPNTQATQAPPSVQPLAAPDEASRGGHPLLPSRESMLYGTIPLVAVTLPGILLVLGVTVAARRIRSARVNRMPSNNSH